MREALVEELVRLTPQQPATVMWRVVELEHLLRAPLPSGFGLDVGCGDGTIVDVVRRLGKADWKLVGVDPDPRETALAERSGQYERVHTASAAEVPEPDASFDFAFSNSVLEHIPGLPTVLAEVARLLKPGAPFLATVPSGSFNDCLAGPGPLGPLLGSDRAAYLDGMDKRLVHLNLWDEQRWRTELEAVGLQLERAEAYLPAADVQRWERLSNWTGGLVWGLTRGKKRPIEATRALDLQSGSQRGQRVVPVTKRFVRKALRGSSPVPSDVPGTTPGYGCLLLHARKPA